MTSRADIIGKPGFYLDRSATGTGKSTADIEAVRQVDRALIVTVTHENTTEIEEDMQAAGLNAMKFPGRHTDGEEINCRNDSADAAERMGLSVLSAVCSVCPHRLNCSQFGYLGQLAAVKAASIAIATQQRSVYNGIDKLAEGRSEYIAIHEDAARVLCPDETVSMIDLEKADSVLDRILNDPEILNWLGQSVIKDDDGVVVPNEKLAERRNRIDKFVRHLAEMVPMLINQAKLADKTQQIVIPKCIPKAPGTDNLLFRASVEMKVSFTNGPWRPILAAASGELHSIGVIVDDSAVSKRKIIIANWRNIPSNNSTVLFCDATAGHDELEMYIGKPVVDITPDGHVERSKRVVQFQKDITRKTSAKSFCATIRGVMSMYPEARRVGVITHRPLVSYLNLIGESFAARIVKATYFGSGADRASNDWYKQCDLIIVAGTPRVNSVVVQQRLIQFGDYGAAGENPDWGEVLWRGLTEAGQEVIVTNRGYRHPLWHKAHRSLVRAELVQAAGRGRSILEDGCEVAIISTEECGFPLVNQIESRTSSLAQCEISLLTYLRDLSAENLPTANLSAENPKRISIEKAPISSGMPKSPPMRSTAEIAVAIGLKERRTREILSGLECRGLVARHGDRGGWSLTDIGRSLLG